MKNLGAPLSLVLASLFAVTAWGEEVDRQCTNKCGDQWEWATSEKIRGISVATKDSECDLKVSVECDGGAAPADKTLPPNNVQRLQCEAGKNIKKITFVCSSSAEGKRCKVSWLPLIEIKVPPGGGTIPYPPHAILEPPPTSCITPEAIGSKDASKVYKDPKAEAACKNDAVNLKAAAQTEVGTICKALCQQKAPNCKWLLLNPGAGQHSCTPNPPSEVLGKASTGVEFCNCMK